MCSTCYVKPLILAVIIINHYDRTDHIILTYVDEHGSFIFYCFKYITSTYARTLQREKKMQIINALQRKSQIRKIFELHDIHFAQIQMALKSKYSILFWITWITISENNIWDPFHHKNQALKISSRKKTKCYAFSEHIYKLTPWIFKKWSYTNFLVTLFSLIIAAWSSISFSPACMYITKEVSWISVGLPLTPYYLCCPRNKWIIIM